MVARAVLSRMVESDPRIRDRRRRRHRRGRHRGARRSPRRHRPARPRNAGRGRPEVDSADHRRRRAARKVMIVSSLAEEGAEQTVAALALGAADTLPKPGTGRFNGRFSEILLGKLKALGYAERQTPAPSRRASAGLQRAASRDAERPDRRARDRRFDRRHPRARRAVPGAARSGSACRSSSPSICRRRSCRCSRASSAPPPAARRWSPRTACALLPDRILIAPGDAHLTRRAGPDGAGRAPDARPQRRAAACRRSTRCSLRSAPSTAPARSASSSPAWAATGSRARRALVACGGSVIAQDEASCAVWGMPRAVLEAGLACAVLPPDKIARRIAVADRGADAVQISDSSSRILAGLLEARTGQQLTMSRRWRIETALVGAAARARHRHARRADHHPRHGQGAEPVAAGGRGAAQQRNLFLPRPLAVRPARSAMRCPSSPKRRAQEQAASASGRRAARPGRKSIRWRCCSPKSPRNGAAGRSTSSAPTCRPRASIARASGIYSQFEVQRGLGINQMISWFEECADGWRAVEPLRKPVRFQVHNLLEPPPHPGEFDIVLCRNVLLYLSPEKKALAFERLAAAMAEDGWLMLGAGETVIGQTEQARRRHQGARALSPHRRRQPGREARRRRPQSCRAGLDPTPLLVRHCAHGSGLHRPAFAQFRRAGAAGLDDRAPLYRHARLPRARSTG